MSEIYYSRMNGLNESSEISEETYNERKRNDAELKTEKLNGIMIMNAGFLIYILICFCVRCCRNFLWVIMHSIFDACIDSWKADPELNNFRYMWNILMYVIPYTLWAFAGGFLIVYVRNPLNELINGDQNIPAETPYAPENKLREGGNNASH